ncbi:MULTISPECIES: hypothetical protein [Catellatospora]|uniref:Uncharacterized protein n=1 Tax=Catellatospora citrea TaxID=53366 RepID=A0A8J3KHH1_9ACTN|nr:MULTISPECIES: hypothetical protein [Catellatospora]RKE11425.1 hypothetical protein C8E86_6352 [Catellatospora citrea]GIF99922.1 hypothetical protein Cci01nite_50160 [Catellatospora citrea]
MTTPGRKISIYFPADVLADVEAADNASALVAEALRMAKRRKQLHETIRRAGYLVTPEGVKRMSERVAALDAQRAAEQ